jgi:predicted metal-dependent hydrolase
MTSAIKDASIKVRRIEFAYPEGSLPHHFMGGDPVMSHVLALLSSLFPEGEDFFVRSVRNYRDRIDDPVLKKAVAGFIGQEAIHGREHRTFNQRLQAMGYQTWLADRLTKGGLWVLAHTTPKAHQLAVTAALEHYTATLAELLLGEAEARELLTEPEVRSLLLWHAIEESEHKAVAFDVFQAVSGKYRIRSGVMHATTVGFVAAVVFGTAVSLLLDWRTYRHPVQVVRSLRRARRSIFLRPSTVARIRDYHRRDFHPDDNENLALLEEWRTQLFGEDGTLAGRLRGAA